MRKQSECNESEYIRAQRQRTLDLEAETAHLKQTISDRDNEIHKLKREIHKLKVRTMRARERLHWNIFQQLMNDRFLCGCVVWSVCLGRESVCVSVCLFVCARFVHMMSWARARASLRQFDFAPSSQRRRHCIFFLTSVC